jgi:hypothetical protein
MQLYFEKNIEIVANWLLSTTSLDVIGYLQPKIAIPAERAGRTTSHNIAIDHSAPRAVRIEHCKVIQPAKMPL